jgi:hypothetical protein
MGHEDYNFYKVKMFKDYRWDLFTIRMILYTCLFTCIMNLVQFASIVRIETIITTPKDISTIFNVTSLFVKWLFLLMLFISIIVIIYLLTKPLNFWQFEWCYRKNDPLDLIDDYQSDEVFSEDAHLIPPPKDASLNWKKLHPPQPPKLKSKDFINQIDSLSSRITQTDENLQSVKAPPPPI